MLKTFLSLIVCSVVAVPAFGHNNHFLPGDAFFSISLPESLIHQWTSSKDTSFKFEYNRFDGQFFACGHLGYSSLTVEDISPELRAGLAEAYWRFASGTRPIYREEGDDEKSQLRQINNVAALIYSKTFDLELPLGLKFNENWKTEGAGRYGGFFESAHAVMMDWKEAASVPPLPIREKLTPDAHIAENYDGAHVIRTPLHISANDIQIILVGFTEQHGYGVMQRCPNLQDILDGKEYAQYMIVTSEQIRDFQCDANGLWEETTIKLPVSAEHSQIPKTPVMPPLPPK